MIASGFGLIVKMWQAGKFDGEELTAALAALSGGFGLVFARDNNVSSEAAGAKTTVEKQ